MRETSVRLLRLLGLLQARRDWSGAALAERLGVSTRTVRNDMERLRELGYEITSRTGTAGGYRLAAGSAVPPLLLDDEEAVAVGLSLRAAASGSITGIEETALRALAKLERTLPKRLRPRLDALRTATVAYTGGGPTADAQTLTVLASACRDHERLRFTYAGRDGTTSARSVEPHTLVYTGRRWYLLAWDRDREDWRTFRADRITPQLPTGPRFTPREPPEDAARRVVRGAASDAYPHRARLRFAVPAEVVAAHDRITPSAALLTPLDDRSCLVETGSASLPDLARYLVGLDMPFEVLDPPELRTELRALAERCLAAARS
ncbi:Predicted DNA-binding transcriptional regulator YafY, contains an HTH and WYL domains [Pseudonocardia thermophila]|uniref:Predicted DNA-binding transcriptional regulator YafY, contains an HTH and WYL domains n=1 Tax=Pseudonocardia thermophila TaxID=1848 RepID=A0A1M6PHC2_PSETH|nr:YafY family protein [Pseudonocardia thermophila]SHK07339.1 Predicted DNA-binding transcriptional regulator YafY, contains an HTH and WYL domains [Pseudonocardia thermophila]